MQTATTPTVPARIASGDGWDFWLVAGDVFRAAVASPLDAHGAPLGKRWECTAAAWERFGASVFAWASDLPSERSEGRALAD